MDEKSDQGGIVVLYNDYTQEQGSKSIWGTTVEAIRKVGILNTGELANNLRTFCTQMEEVFEGVVTNAHEYELSTVELVVEITAKGEIRLLGSGIGSDIKGGVKLVLSKRETKVMP